MRRISFPAPVRSSVAMVACSRGLAVETSLGRRRPCSRSRRPCGALMAEWYFVWVEGLRGPAPQKWSSDGLWGQIGRQDVIVRFTLSDQEAGLSLDELARLHPIPDRR